MNTKYIFIILFPLSLLFSFSSSMGAQMAGETANEAMGFIGEKTCIECHESQYQSYARTVHSRKAIKGPQSQDACETCHGGGAMHVEKGGGRDVDIFAFDEDVDPAAKSAKCLTCHANFPAWIFGI